ncbi:MAG: type II toxin-antitoxin system RelB/DinJ family antitoxin [Saezia sp.]
MANTTNISIRMDKDLKEQAEKLYGELGMNLTTAFNIFVRQSVRQGGIPFDVTTKTDPFFSESNLQVLRQSIQEANEGKLTAHDLFEG